VKRKISGGLNTRSECVLCASDAVLFFTDKKSNKKYFHCKQCDIRFLDPQMHLQMDAEFDRYRAHENSIAHEGYRKFVAPLYELIKSKLLPKSSALDFGCGNASTLAHLLQQDGHAISLYDPFFYPDTEVLEQQYDLVYAVEVIEHFFEPSQEFAHLKELLKPGAALAVMTFFYSSDIDFESWVYRNDPTHVCFYSEQTMQWIKRRYQFSAFEKYDNRIGWLVL
jgi:cyclopropane fatty-acyl-phospholipid synthase-like methyltransferase